MMKITHYLYNAFLIEEGSARVAIDPGQNLGLFSLHSLIPETEWATVTHIVITHGDPDHYWQADRVAKASKAHVICGRGLARIEDGRTLLVAPRGRELTTWVEFDNTTLLDVGESVALDGVGFEALKAVHGPIDVAILGFKFHRQPGPGERVGLGAMGFEITLGDNKVVNLGDSLLQNEWAGLQPDVLMVPIGGLVAMDVTAALEAVRLIAPKRVIPCHYDVPVLWNRHVAPANDEFFKREVEALGMECSILGTGDQLVVS